MASRSPDNQVPLENVLSVAPGLFDHLSWQLHMMACPDELLEACDFIIGNLDEDGFLRSTDEEIIRERFHLSGNEGMVLEYDGAVTENVRGGAFLYTNRNSLSLGIIGQVSSLVETKKRPYDLLEVFIGKP